MSEDKKLLLRDTVELLTPEVTSAEEAYRRKEYPNSKAFLKVTKIKCSTCPRDVKSEIVNHLSLIIHPSLGFIICKNCSEFYRCGEFSVDEDGSDKYCRWCGQGGSLYCCSDCSVAICAKCVKSNFPRSYLSVIEADDWRCFICDPKPIWAQRALCFAAKRYIQEQRSSRKSKRMKKEASDSEDTTPLQTMKRSKNFFDSSDDNVEEDERSEPKRSRRIAFNETKVTGRTRRNGSPMVIDEEEEEKKETRRARNKGLLKKESDESEEEKEEVKENSNKRQRSSDDEKPTNVKKIAKVPKRSNTARPSRSPKKKQNFLVGLLQNTLNDFEKLTKVMIKSKQDFCKRYLSKNHKSNDMSDETMLTEKLLALLKNSKDSIDNIERTYQEGLKSLKEINLTENCETANKESADDAEVKSQEASQNKSLLNGDANTSKASVNSEDETIATDDPVIVEENSKDPLASSSDTDLDAMKAKEKHDTSSEKDDKFEDALMNTNDENNQSQFDMLLNRDSTSKSHTSKKSSEKCTSTPTISGPASPDTDQSNSDACNQSDSTVKDDDEPDPDSTNSSKSDIFAESPAPKLSEKKQPKEDLAKKAFLLGSDSDEDPEKDDSESNMSGINFLKTDAEKKTKMV